MRLSSEIVDLVGAESVDPAAERRGVGEIGVVELHASLVSVVRVDVDVVDSLCVEVGGTADQAVNLVALIEEEFSEIRAVLAGDPSDQSNFPGRV